MTRIKTVRKKGKMKPKEKGKPMPYKKLDKSKADSARSIRGIYAGWKKAPKYLLRLQTTPSLRWYLGKDSNITEDRKSAQQFALGYDSPAIKEEYWSRQLGLTFKQEAL